MNNTIPYFVQDLSDVQYTKYVQAKQPYKLYLGEVVDDERDRIEIVFRDASNRFITFDANQTTFNIDTYETPPGNYSVSLFLNEYSKAGFVLSSNKYMFYIEVIELEEETDPPIFFI